MNELLTFEDDLASARASRITGGREWAVFMLATRTDVLFSILLDRPVLASRLDRGVLTRALRGGPLPPADSFVHVTGEMLDAISEAGPLQPRPERGKP